MRTLISGPLFFAILCGSTFAQTDVTESSLQSYRDLIGMNWCAGTVVTEANLEDILKADNEANLAALMKGLKLQNESLALKRRGKIEGRNVAYGQGRPPGYVSKEAKAADITKIEATIQKISHVLENPPRPVPTINLDSMRVGQVGRLIMREGNYTNTFQVVQIVNETQMLMHKGPRQTNDVWFMVTGINTKTIVDDETVRLAGDWKVAGTVTYNSLGGKRTVYELQRFDMSPYLRRIESGEASKENTEPDGAAQAWNKRWTEGKHKWRDATGEHSVEAVFDGYLGKGDIRLLREDGSEIVIALSKLSDEDRRKANALRKDGNALNATPPVEARKPALANAVDASQFVGKWRILDDRGRTATWFTLTESFRASKSHAPDVSGKWEVVRNEARITWGDGWRDVLRLQEDGAAKLAYKPETSWDDAPANVQSAVKE